MCFTLLSVFTLCVVMLSGTSAFADAGFTCSPSSYHENFYDLWSNDFVCLYNPLHLSMDECSDLCWNSDYCKIYEDESRSIFGGFWRISDKWMKYESFWPDLCATNCNRLKEQCAPNDQDCLARFIPQNIDCSLLTDKEDYDYCNQNCVDNILTSECGSSCLKNGFNKDSGDTYYVDGCKASNQFCSLLCEEGEDNYHCASIPMNYDTKWSVFGILMAFLAAMSGLIIVVMHRDSKSQNQDNHS